MVQELRCSRYVNFLTYFMVGFPPAYLLFAWIIFELDSKGILSVVLSPLFYLASFFWIVSGAGIRRLRKWSWYTFLIAQFFITYLNALNLVLYSQSEFKIWAFILTLVVQTYVLVAISKELRVPYLFPKIRWWESGIAGMPNIPVLVVRSDRSGAEMPGFMLDLNLKGCFIKTHHDFESFEKVNVRIGAFGQELDLSGVVMWNAKSTVTHPKGIGIRFNPMPRQQRRSLRVVSQKFLRQKDPKKNETRISS